MSERKHLHFSIDGEFITNMAREKFFMDKDLAGALRLLRSATVNDRMSSDEQLMLCLQILHGAASIVGNSDDESYGVCYRDDIDERPTDLSSIALLISDMAAKLDSLKKENHDMTNKISFLAGQFSDFKLQEINSDYYNETGEYLFSLMPIPDWKKSENQYDGMSDMLSSYLKQRKYEQKMLENDEEPENDYGWLEPDGTWHPVEWGFHSDWANNWLNENMPFKDNPEIYWHIDKNGNRRHITGGDVLVLSLNWVLLDNPYHGIAHITRNQNKKMTKAQKEFLYDYYIQRDCHSQANALYED